MIAATLTALLAIMNHQDGPNRATGPVDDRRRSGVDLDRRVADYTARFGRDTGYSEPTSADRRTIAEGVGLLLDGHRSQAQQRLSDVDFEIRTIVDSATGRRYEEVADRTDDSPTPRGWGRVYIGLDSPARWSVQVPHPVADAHTEHLGVRVLRGSQGGVLVIAGAHRKAGDGNAADVAHRRDTVFNAICDELTLHGLPGVQVHGFADDSAPRYDVIASTGKGRIARNEGRGLADALHARDFAVCRAWVRSCPLAGHTNMQGRAAADQRVPFLHVEFSNRLRTNDGLMARAVEAVNVVTSRWAVQPVHRS
ncbi:hypothetical protein ACWCP6_21615 [Streptomyces sp. NPDC002004]